VLCSSEEVRMWTNRYVQSGREISTKT
jgi:hypothetical protein